MASSFVITAPKSGGGKTTFSLGLMRALEREGMDVRPFKCGPDYIDPHFHYAASGRGSVNLDVFLSSESHVKELFDTYSQGGDVNIVEGAMGMFDGYDKMRGSCAEIARLLDIPVVLVVDATATSYSVAATIYGFKNFRPDTRLAGVVFNRVASSSHFDYLRSACEDTGVECFGYVKRDTGLQTPSRHLGLTLTGKADMERFIDNAASAVAETVDLKRLLEATRVQSDGATYLKRQGKSVAECPTWEEAKKLTIAVARDEAFNFLYRANIDSLRNRKDYNIDIQYFSPLIDSDLPRADIVYLPGGYPELYSRQLSQNSEMREAVRNYVEAGGRLLAECGGMIYMGQEIDGEQMCGVLPLHVTMDAAKLHLGYREMNVDGLTFRGHEFHYSRVTDDEGMTSAATQTDSKGRVVDTPLYKYKNCFAGYTHLYWADKDILGLWK